MPLQLTADELREVVLAINAYKEALERYNGSGSVESSIQALESARVKLNRACRQAQSAAAEQ